MSKGRFPAVLERLGRTHRLEENQRANGAYGLLQRPGKRKACRYANKAMYRQAMADGAPFDVVIMDLTVPGGIGGKDAIKALLAMDPQAKAIVSSGYADDPVMANYADYGFKDIAIKPYTPNELRTVLARVLK